jgi:hypothetical protein
MALTRGGATKAWAAVARARATLATVREKTEQTVGVVISGAETTGAAVALGYANVVWGQKNGGELRLFGKVPLDLALGIALHTVGIFDGAGKYSEHAHAFGNGALASFGSRFGAKLGLEHLTKQSQQPAQMSGGWAPGQTPDWQAAQQYPAAA